MKPQLKTRAALAAKSAALALWLAAGGLSVLAGAAIPAQSAQYIKPGSGVQVPRQQRVPETRQVLRDGQLIHREGGPLAEPWGINKEMSRACSRGLFKQRRDRYFIAIFKRRVYGAAVGGHRSLVDKVGLSKEKIIYLFDRQGTTDCRVYHRGKA